VSIISLSIGIFFIPFKAPLNIPNFLLVSSNAFSVPSTSCFCFWSGQSLLVARVVTGSYAPATSSATRNSINATSS